MIKYAVDSKRLKQKRGILLFVEANESKSFSDGISGRIARKFNHDALPSSGAL